MLNTHPTISYLLPAYNAEAFIADCLESLLPIPIHKEIIIINDGSTDHTGQIVTQYAQQHGCIQAYHQANIGASATRNRALDIARGKWIVFVDADDVVVNEANLPPLLALADQQSVDVIKGLSLFSSDADPVSIKPPVLDGVVDEHQAVTVSGRTFLEKCIGVHRFQTNNSFLIRRATIEKFGLRFDPAQFIGEDVLFFYQLFSDDIKVMEVPFVFYHYQKRAVSLSNPGFTVLDLKYVRSRSRLLDSLLAVAKARHHLHSAYIRYKLLDIQLSISKNYYDALKLGYPLEKANAEPFFKYVLKPDDYAKANAYSEQLIQSQSNRTYHRSIPLTAKK